MSAESKSNSAMAFILGAVVVILAGVVWYVYSGGSLPGEDEADIQIELPGVEVERQ